MTSANAPAIWREASDLAAIIMPPFNRHGSGPFQKSRAAGGSNPRFTFLAHLLLLGAAVATMGSAAEHASGWRAGVAAEKITPRQPLWMSGYAVRDRPSDGIAQDLWVKALAFEDAEGKRAVLLTADLCAITRAVSDHVARELEKSHRLPRSAIMTNVSHTHCAPIITGSIPGLRILPPEGTEAIDAYTRELEGIMTAAARKALDSLEPAALSWSEDEATFGINRRNNPESQAPALRAAGQLKGPSDPRVPVLAAHNARGELMAVLVSYACHNTTLRIYQWHGDYAGCAQEEIQRRHPGAIALFASGCGADINPNPRTSVALAEQHGRSLADAVDRALAKPLRRVSGRFQSSFADITLTFARRPTEAEIREAREKIQPNREMHQAWAEAVSRRLQTLGDDAMKHDYPIQVWKLGDLHWAALGGEVVIDYALRLREEFGSALWVFGYSTDVMAYIPSERVLREGGYEGGTSMVPYGLPGPWSAGLEEKIVGKTRELLIEEK